MKRFMEFSVQFKFIWSLFFSTALLLYAIIGMFLGKTGIDFITLWEIVLLTLLLTTVYYLIFGELILNSLTTKYRVILHFLLNYLILLIFAEMLTWVSFSNICSLIVFSAGYVLLYLAALFSFYAYYKATGEELNDKLASYKEKKSIK